MFSQWQAYLGNNIPSYRRVCKDPPGAIALARFRFIVLMTSYLDALLTSSSLATSKP